MKTEKMGEIYQQIAEGINEIIPSEWEKVILYAEILDDSSEVFFYFNPPQSEDYIYSHNIPEHFHVSEDVYDELLLQLHDSFEELRDEFKENNQDVWTNLTLQLEINGKLSIEYDYEDVLQSQYTISQRKTIWVYEHLGTYPKRESVRTFLEQYIQSKSEH
ncbi:antitoxin YezG family protein [Bacillus spizizenii]|nr:antitoxin YezG family protein [Bacillus spizizenii]MCY8130906.1 antitoxin YezG family protein [Bacillus spizizenii]MCY8460976.1 antitoxin YezG family protein [Bacillus spizizenii]MCY8873942.1 antitoxin YezG family protein [Bacillus spizizenii]MCY8885333.1 antitoxin YezG family protein [Bacillus spizizenii]